MKTSIIVSALFFSCGLLAYGQSGFSAERMGKMLHTYKQNNDGTYNERFTEKIEADWKKEYIESKINDVAVILTPQFPQNFTKLAKDDNDEWQLSGELNFGVSYGIIIGKMFKEKGQEHAPVQPYFGVAFQFSGGTTQDFKDGEGLRGNLNIGASIIILKNVNLFIGHDLLNDTSIIGLGARVDLVGFDGFGGVLVNQKRIMSRI